MSTIAENLEYIAKDDIANDVLYFEGVSSTNNDIVHTYTSFMNF